MVCSPTAQAVRVDRSDLSESARMLAAKEGCDVVRHKSTHINTLGPSNSSQEIFSVYVATEALNLCHSLGVQRATYVICTNSACTRFWGGCNRLLFSGILGR